MTSIIENEQFLKDKYLFSLVSHNLEYDDSQIITDNANYAIVIGKPNKEIWIWSNSLNNDVVSEIILTEDKKEVNIYIIPKMGLIAAKPFIKEIK